MRETHWPDLGIGVGLRPDHHDRFVDSPAPPSSVGWVEVVTENFLRWPDERETRAQRRLERVRERLPVVLHGVSLSPGSPGGAQPGLLDRIDELCRRVEPAWVSDHLCFTRVDGRNTHDLMPLPYTEEALAVVVENVSRAQDWLGRRILLENVSSYVEFACSEMTEWDFLAEVARRADCGILLDVNNVYVSATNHGFSVESYLRALPRERVGQIHLAGHSRRPDGLLIDTHSAPVCDEVWALYRRAVELFGPISAMIERDEAIPTWEELEAECLRAARERDSVTRRPARGGHLDAFAP